MKGELTVRLYGKPVGTLFEEPRGKIGFSYDEAWISDWLRGAAHPVSLSLPVSDNVLDATPFVAGLLPDNSHHRKSLAAELGIEDESSDFALLARVGADSAGALTIVPSGHAKETPVPSVEWLTESSLAENLRSLPRRPLLIDEEHGIMLSLAGVNDKAAVVYKKGAVGLPKHGYPSTHIIKTDITGLKDSIKTEHFCLTLARAVGIRAPLSRLAKAEDQEFMIMERYDRRTVNGVVERTHQEDYCQAFGFMPVKKYERFGGPGWAECFDLLKNASNTTAARNFLLSAAAFQFLIGNPDAHAKNYSLVYDKNGLITPSPLYDLNNAAAFRHHFKRARPIMAMRIGGQENRDEVTVEDWSSFADEVNVSAVLVLRVLSALSRRILSALPKIEQNLAGCEAVARAAEDIRARCEAWSGPKGPSGELTP